MIAEIKQTKKKNSQPSFSPQKTHKQPAMGKFHQVTSQQQQQQRLFKGKPGQVYIYIFLSISGRHLQLQDCDSCSTTAASLGGKARHNSTFSPERSPESHKPLLN